MKQVFLTEEQYNRLFLNEVRYITSPIGYHGNYQHIDRDRIYDWEHQDPIKDGEKIRVFHGCDVTDAIKFATEGISGEKRVSRNYSYESWMNPAGLFVTTNFYVAKKFGFHYEDMVIIEFTVDTRDLDTPVWNGQSTYFGQDSNPQSFRNKGERDVQRNVYHYDAKQSEYDYVRNSDNPAMAEKIFINNENQALFFGDLNPNMIKRFWVKKIVNGNQPQGDYQAYTRKEFLKMYADKINKKSSEKKLFLPTENITDFNDVVQRLVDFETEIRFKSDFNEVAEELRGCIKALQDDNSSYGARQSAKNILSAYLHPRQIVQLIGTKAYQDNFNMFFPQQYRKKSKYEWDTIVNNL